MDLDQKQVTLYGSNSAKRLHEGTIYLRWDISPKCDVSPESYTVHLGFTWEEYLTWMRCFSS